MNCKNAPDSDFMVQYLKDFQKGKYQITTPTNLEKNSKNLVEKSNLKIEFSAQAKDVLNAGKNLFKYYHEQTNSEFPNASLYDIKKYFSAAVIGTDTLISCLFLYVYIIKQKKVFLVLSMMFTTLISFTAGNSYDNLISENMLEYNNSRITDDMLDVISSEENNEVF